MAARKKVRKKVKKVARRPRKAARKTSKQRYKTADTYQSLKRADARLSVSARATLRRKNPKAIAWDPAKGAWVSRWTGKVDARAASQAAEGQKQYDREHAAHVRKGYCAKTSYSKFCWNNKGHRGECYFRYNDPQFD